MSEELEAAKRMRDALSATYDSGYRAGMQMALVYLEVFAVQTAIEKIHDKLNKEKSKDE